MAVGGRQEEPRGLESNGRYRCCWGVRLGRKISHALPKREKSEHRLGENEKPEKNPKPQRMPTRKAQGACTWGCCCFSLSRAPRSRCVAAGERSTFAQRMREQASSQVRVGRFFLILFSWWRTGCCGAAIIFGRRPIRCGKEGGKIFDEMSVRRQAHTVLMLIDGGDLRG